RVGIRAERELLGAADRARVARRGAGGSVGADAGRGGGEGDTRWPFGRALQRARSGLGCGRCRGGGRVALAGALRRCDGNELRACTGVEENAAYSGRAARPIFTLLHGWTMPDSREIRGPA